MVLDRLLVAAHSAAQIADARNDGVGRHGGAYDADAPV